MEREGFTVELDTTYFCSGKYLQTKITNTFNGMIVKFLDKKRINWLYHGNSDHERIFQLFTTVKIWISQKSKKHIKCKTTYFDIDSMNIK